LQTEKTWMNPLCEARGSNPFASSRYALKDLRTRLTGP